MERIGYVAVDAGIVMVGDPCYTLSDDASHRNDVARDWSLFCERLKEAGQYDNGYCVPFDQTTAVVVQTGYGDGVYPVYVKRERGMIVRLVVDFDPEPSECVDCSDPAEQGSDRCAECQSDYEDYLNEQDE